MDYFPFGKYSCSINVKQQEDMFFYLDYFKNAYKYLEYVILMATGELLKYAFCSFNVKTFVWYVNLHLYISYSLNPFPIKS